MPLLAGIPFIGSEWQSRRPVDASRRQRIGSFVPVKRLAWLNAFSIRGGLTKFECTCIILVILCWVIKSTGEDEQVVFPGRCFMLGNLVSAIRATASGKRLRRL